MAERSARVCDAPMTSRRPLIPAVLQLLGRDEDRALRFVTANDRTRIDQGDQTEAGFAASSFTFTRWTGFAPGRYTPGRNASAEVYGWAFAEGMPAYFLFLKGSRAYKVFLSTSAARPSSRGTWRTARVTRSASASASRSQPMRRAG
jgi:hypothetical protein